jgi:hypothetical protein
MDFRDSGVVTWVGSWFFGLLWWVLGLLWRLLGLFWRLLGLFWRLFRMRIFFRRSRRMVLVVVPLVVIAFAVMGRLWLIVGLSRILAGLWGSTGS